MTTKPARTQRDTTGIPPLPDPPKKDMQQHINFVLPAIPSIVARHLGALDPTSTTLVGGDAYLCQTRSDLPSCPYPDMVVAINVNPGFIISTNGYVIDEVGKPPDLVLEVASHTTGRRDYIAKRGIYARLKVPEYWWFDHSGGQYYDAPLAFDRLSPDGSEYVPEELTKEPGGVIWGYSEVLKLSVCCVEGRLRFWDRDQQRYLPNPSELADELAEAQARIRALEEELQSRIDR